MFGMLRAAFTLLICFLALGFYLGWFRLKQTPPDPRSNEVNVNVAVDKNKMGTDLRKFERNVATRLENINNNPQQGNSSPQAPQQPAAPGLNIGPISIQPFGSPPAQQQQGQTWPAWPNSPQPPSQPILPPGAPATGPAPDYQYNAPLSVPPPSEGR